MIARLLSGALTAWAVAVAVRSGWRERKREVRLGQTRAGRALTAADFTDLGLSAPNGLWNLGSVRGAVRMADLYVMVEDGAFVPVTGDSDLDLRAACYGMSRAPGETDERLRERLLWMHGKVDDRSRADVIGTVL